MNIPSSSTPSRERALVLGGGGATGDAWLTGVIALLFAAGVDVTAPDRTIGTSAGSTAAAQLGAAGPAELYAAALTPIPPRSAPSGPAPARPAVSVLQRLTDLIAVSEDAADYRRRLSAAAL